MTKQDIKQNIQGKLDYNLETLKEMAKMLSKDMQRLADRIECEGEEACINSLGEIQGKAQTIDNICATIGILKDIKKTIE